MNRRYVLVSGTVSNIKQEVSNIFTELGDSVLFEEMSERLKKRFKFNPLVIIEEGDVNNLRKNRETKSWGVKCYYLKDDRTISSKDYETF